MRWGTPRCSSSPCAAICTSGHGKLRRKIPALLLAAALLGTAGCAAGTENPPSAGLSPEAASEAPTEPSAGLLSDVDAALPLPPPPDGEEQEPSPTLPDEGEREPSLPERLFVPVSAAAVVLLGIVIWLVLIRRRGRKSEKKTPPAPARRDDFPVTTAPVTGPIVYRVGNLHHIGQREEQQDSFCLSDIGDEAATREKRLLAVVADGMGGLEGGALISQRVTDTFLARYRELTIPNADSFLYDSVMAAEKAVEELMAASGVNGGSTVVAVLLRGGRLHFISVGDSRIYLLRRDALTAYIGMGSLKRIDQSERPIPLQPGDKVLLCSDGVFNALGGDALAGDAAQAAARLEEAVLAQRLANQDNFTGVVLEWEESK